VEESSEIPERPLHPVSSRPQMGSRYAVASTVTTLGRDPDNHVPLEHPSVSDHHAEIELRDGRYWIHDLGSFHGTYVNGVRVEHAPLQHGDEVKVGRLRLIFLGTPP
jgi:pSer/pThr/pTyr-binding forkhead associated (FHA) protein